MMLTQIVKMKVNENTEHLIKKITKIDMNNCKVLVSVCWNRFFFKVLSTHIPMTVKTKIEST